VGPSKARDRGSKPALALKSSNGRAERAAPFWDAAGRVFVAVNITDHHCIICAKAANSRDGASPPFGKDSPSFFQVGPNLSLGNPSRSKV
jgi:hypothetical protein